MEIRGEGPAYFEYQVEQPAEPYGRLPKPTLAAGEEGQHGRVNVMFVVTTDGTVDMRTVKVNHADGPALTAAVCRALPQARFRPAVLGRRTVRMVYQTDFRF
jgi:TonB family protein